VNVFVLPASVDTDDPERAFADLLAGGVRSLLLHGGPDLGEPFLHRQLVDELIIAVRPADHIDDAAARPATSSTSFLPTGFRIRAVQRLESGSVLHAIPTTDCPEIG
jgi:riboflavin biosynthesis pyrimidine reductase